MSFFRNIKRLLSFRKQQTNIDTKISEPWEYKKKLHLEWFSRDARMQELYPTTYLQLQKELSADEWRELEPVIRKQKKIETRKEKLQKRLDENETMKNKYGDMYAQLPNVVSDEELERYENILQDYESRERERNHWILYLNDFPKLKEKYAREYELLQKDLSTEEICSIVENLLYEKRLLQMLMCKYEDYVKETTEANYATGKVEKLYDGYIFPDELMRKYPEEAEALIEYYGPEFDEYFFEKDGSPKDYPLMESQTDEFKKFQFKDMLLFREFIERNHVFGKYVITDKEYTVISDKLRRYVPAGAIRGIAGSFTGYSISYENFLQLKKYSPDLVALYASKETEDTDIIHFISEVRPFLTEKKVEYMV